MFRPSENGMDGCYLEVYVGFTDLVAAALYHCFWYISYRLAKRLIPPIFHFLVLLSYERYHSKSIINVPKIIQLCDGIIASGQPAMTHGTISFPFLKLL